MKIEPPISQSYGWWNTPQNSMHAVMEKPYPKCGACGNDSLHPLIDLKTVVGPCTQLICAKCGGPFMCKSEDIKWVTE